MEDVGGCTNLCWSRNNDNVYDEFMSFSVTSAAGSKAPVWRLLWRKIKRDHKKRSPAFGQCSSSSRFRYDPSAYEQNFDHGLMWNDSDDLSRSFSARFAVPSRVFHDNRLILH